MELVLIRHGDTDYTPADERGFIGHGRDLAPLSLEGIRQAEHVAKDPALKGCQMLLSSPYTRALQTAAIISRGADLPIRVEMDLHEWLPDKSHQYASTDEMSRMWKKYVEGQGDCPPGENCQWESAGEMIERLKPVFDRYLREGWQRLAVAAHGMVIRRMTGLVHVAHCVPYEVLYHEAFSWYGYIETQ